MSNLPREVTRSDVHHGLAGVVDESGLSAVDGGVGRLHQAYATEDPANEAEIVQTESPPY
jgi:hypothetical protein